MRISRFELKLIIIFLALLLIPTATFTYLTRRILTASLGFLANKRMEEVLGEGLEMAQRLIESERRKCKAIAGEIRSQLEVQPRSLDHDERPSMDRYLKGEISTSSISSIRIIDSEEGIWVSVGKASKDEPGLTDLMRGAHHGKTPFSVVDGDRVYGVAPIMNGEDLAGAVIVSKDIDPQLIKGINDISGALRVYSSLGMLRDELQRTTWTILVALISLSTISSILVAVLLARGITKPIMDLARGAEEIAGGNLDYQVKTRAKGEIGALVEAFNSMTRDLKENRRKLLQAERVAAWRDIARRIAHEIKNPITPIRLSIFRLQRNLKTEDEEYARLFNECFDTIIAEIENLRNLADEFSKFARMPEPKFETCDVNELVRDALSLYESLPNEINLVVRLTPDLPPIDLDSGQIKQVLHNLIANAVDAMPNGGKLEVTTGLEGDMIFIEVADTGCGMSEEVKSKLFTPYFTTKKKGMGLGMAIVHRIIEQHDGKIEVESQEGVGTTVRVLLGGSPR
jgi:nitrogen fixation/metabolism regulation signal transduction histidine kinase